MMENLTHVENWILKTSRISKTGQNDFKLHSFGWFGMIFENIQSDPPKEVRGQS